MSKRVKESTAVILYFSYMLYARRLFRLSSAPSELNIEFTKVTT